MDTVAVVGGFGAELRRIRRSVGWSQRTLGSRVGLSQPAVSLFERGRLSGLSIDRALALAGALGATVELQVHPPYLAGRGNRERQHDAGHARLSAHVRRRLDRQGWQSAVEVKVGGGRSYGWIDILSHRPATGQVLVIELKTEVRDLGQIERTLGWYQREAWAAARRRGWRPRAIRGCLLLLATEANDRFARANRANLDLEFPCRARDATAILRGEALANGWLLAMLDPRSRRTAWLRPLQIDGRRSTAPYVDDADFMRAAPAGRGSPRIKAASIGGHRRHEPAAP